MAYSLSSATGSREFVAFLLYKMASSHPKLLCVGDYVLSEGRTCFITKIVNSLGFNTYHIVDMDSGVVLTKARYQLEYLPILASGDDDADFQQQNIELKQEKTTERFANVSSSDLDEMELNRSSLKMKQQTLWAVKILKG